ncbi:MAG TPA: hypothetical protein VJL27_01835 [Patescibacteria group bacterium]|nr:hypothetical protein [Patescibacteria group bacterium]
MPFTAKKFFPTLWGILFIAVCVALLVLGGGNKQKTLAASSATGTCTANLNVTGAREGTITRSGSGLASAVSNANSYGLSDSSYRSSGVATVTVPRGGAVSLSSTCSNDSYCGIAYFWVSATGHKACVDHGGSCPVSSNITLSSGWLVLREKVFGAQAVCLPKSSGDDGGGGGGGGTTATLSTSPRVLTLDVDEIKTVTVSKSDNTLKNFRVESSDGGMVRLHRVATPDSSDWNENISVIGTGTQFKMKGISRGTTNIVIKEFSGGEQAGSVMVYTGVNKTASVTVSEDGSGNDDTTELTVEPSSVTLEVGGSAVITVTGLSADDSSPNSIFRISNNTVPTVASSSTPFYYNSGASRRGTFTVTGLAEDETVMTVSSGNSITPQDVTVRVVPAPPVNTDSDGDGVDDSIDICIGEPGSQVNMIVDATGCEITIVDEGDTPPGRPDFGDFIPPVGPIEDEAATPPVRPVFRPFVECAKELNIVPYAWNMLTYPFVPPSGSATSTDIGAVFAWDYSNIYSFVSINPPSYIAGANGKAGKSFWSKSIYPSLCLVGSGFAPLTGTQEINFPADQEAYYELNMTGNPFIAELPWVNVKVNDETIQQGFQSRNIAAIFLFDPTLNSYVTYYDAARFTTVQPPNPHAYTELSGATLAPYRGFWLMTKDGVAATVTYDNTP